MLLGAESSFWSSTEKGGPALIGAVIACALVFVFVKYLIWPIVQLIAQTASDFRIASENHRISQQEHRQTLTSLKEHEAMFGSKLRQADEMLDEARELLEPLKPKSGTHALASEAPTR